MTVLRIDNIGIVVEDIDAAVAFFVELGLELEGRTTVEGEWVDRTIGLVGAKCDIAMLRPPEGHGGVELSRFRTPPATHVDPAVAPVNTLGYLRAQFAVDDLRAVLARLERLGATLIGEIVNYQDVYLLCYVRAPEGFIVGLAQPLAEGG
jgi:catechol 2,3-dioxygenase-like lactoylglutathione lyase family enzyme